MNFDTQEQKIYHARLMSARIVIDALDFVRNTRSLHGKIALEEFRRLKDYLADSQGELEYNINGALDKNSRSILKVIIKGKINLFCQRCLEKLDHELNLEPTLYLAKNEKELSHIDHTELIEGILAVSDIDVIELIEDEIILSLPISPRHREYDCLASKLTSNHFTAKKKPFAILAKLKNYTKIT